MSLDLIISSSQFSSNNYGLLMIPVKDPSDRKQLLSLHSQEIFDVKANPHPSSTPHESLCITVSLDKTLCVCNIVSGNLVQRYGKKKNKNKLDDDLKLTLSSSLSSNETTNKDSCLVVVVGVATGAPQIHTWFMLVWTMERSRPLISSPSQSWW